MNAFETALPPAGPAKPTQNPAPAWEIDRRDRLILAGSLLWCLLAVDGVFWSWPWGAGVTAALFFWYALLLAVRGKRLWETRESRCLLAVCLALGASFSLGSNPWFRLWNALALLALVPLHTCALSGAALLPWWQPAMLWERAALFLRSLFGAVGAAFAALSPGKHPGARRMLAAALGAAGALLLLAVLVPVLASADALFSSFTAALRTFVRLHFTTALAKLLWALILTPFAFSLLYRLRRPAAARPRPAGTLRADAAFFLILLAAVDLLYLAFLLVQSAGLFGGADYLAQRGISYAQWARSGFFQMTGVTVVNLTVLLSAVGLSRRGGRGWSLVRALAVILCAESLLLLASAAWRMGLYVSAYGLSFKRCMTFWGMVMMALLFLCALRTVLRPERSFCRWAFPIVLAGWLVINCIPLDYLVARDQVDRCLTGESAVIDADYLLSSLSYDALAPLERLDGTWKVSTVDGAISLETLTDLRREEARVECADWRSWNLSAFLAGMR